jgi:nitrogen regulatory protein PII
MRGKAMKIVTAIVRPTGVQHVIQQLEKIGIQGLTISEVKGIGEEVRLNNLYSVHDKIEIFVHDEKADKVTQVILEHAATGLAGDGVVAVLPTDYAVRIGTGERLA